MLPYIDRAAWRLWNNGSKSIRMVLTQRHSESELGSRNLSTTAVRARKLIDNIRARVKLQTYPMDWIIFHRGVMHLRVSDKLFDAALQRRIEAVYPKRSRRGMEQAEWVEEWVEG